MDPYGQTTVLTRDSARRLWKVTEPGGRYLEIHYKQYQFWVEYPRPEWRIVQVIDYVEARDGRGNIVETVRYQYTPENVPPLQYYNLTQVNYDDGVL